MDYTPLYIGTGAMLVFSSVLIFTILKITNIHVYIKERDEHILNKVNSLEKIINKDIKDILEILKSNYEKNLKLDKRKST